MRNPAWAGGPWLQQFHDLGFFGLRGNDPAALLARDVGILETMTGNGADNAGAVRDARDWADTAPIVSEAFQKPGNGCGAGGFHEDSLAGGEKALRIEDIEVTDNIDGSMDSRIAPRPVASSRGCRCGWRWRRSPDPGRSCRNRSARLPPPESRAFSGGWMRGLSHEIPR